MTRSIVAAAIALQASAAVAQEVDAFRSPAVNRQVYRESEVRRLTGTFKDWQVSCDDITGLKQRYCSLFSQARSADGKTLLGMVVTTTDDGKPAAMLELPFGVRLSSDVAVTTVSATGKMMKPNAETRLRIIRCSPAFCMTLWQLTAAQIAALNGAGSLKVRLQAPSVRFAWPGLPTRGADRPIDVTMSSAGFKEAIAATQGSAAQVTDLAAGMTPDLRRSGAEH